MDTRLLRAYLVELLGTFAFVFVAGGIACVNVVTTATDAALGATPLTTHQPGLLGVALGQALVWAALVAWSVPVSGGFLNPAIAIMRWVFGQLSSPRMAWFVGAQILGSVVAGLALMAIFEPPVLRAGMPFLNPLAFPIRPDGDPQGVIWTGLAIELVLTFFFALAIFARVEKLPAPWLSGAILAGAVLFAGPLTGAALNPARWFGPTFWQLVGGSSGAAARQALVYVAGPIVGALLAGTFLKIVYEPALADGSRDEAPTRPGK